MPTNVRTAYAAASNPTFHASREAEKVVIVNGTADALALIDTALNSGHYDVVFVESSEHAYSQIKRVQPQLVILCVRIEDRSAFQVLSMLKLDAATRDIPVLTYTTTYEGQITDDVETDTSEPEIFAAKPPAVPMN
jgi:PleD family two-component response regulator